MNKFLCSECSKEHDTYASMEILEPSLLHNMSEEERKRRVITSGFLHIIDKSFVLTKGDLFIKIKEQDSFMHWEAWVKLSASGFLR